MNKTTAIALAAATLASVPLCCSAAGASSAPAAVSHPDQQNRPSSQIGDSVTRHSLMLKGARLRYRATAGRLIIADDDDKPEARMFYVAYTRDGASERDRPVTFLFNGGPGSSSIYLHMGSFAPVRMRAPDPRSPRPVPPGLEPNPSTLLDVTDLVFIDMIGTGYSRPEPGVSGKKFWNVDGDADSFSRFIKAWLRTNGRSLSPKFIFGESYGTARAATLANRLQNTGVAVNGVMLAGAVLNLGIFGSGYDQNFVSYLPSMAASAWYHHKAGEGASNLPSFLDEARAFAAGPYQQALAKGHDLPKAEKASIAAQYAKLTGLSVDYVLGADLRVQPEDFRKELLRSESRIIGGFDARFTGVDSSDTGQNPEGDPANTVVETSLSASLENYLQRDLGYRPDISYRFGIQERPEFDFDFRHQDALGHSQLVADTAVDLAAAMRNNPNLQVAFFNGYFDLRTPFGAAEYDGSHMLLDQERRKNLAMHYYEAGHMLYFDDKVLGTLHDDIRNFILNACQRSR
jgi:carboxypeptidase C (cathepsin A)